MKLLLNNKDFLIFDKEDIVFINSYKWRVSKKLKYVKTTIKNKTYLLHRLLLNLKENQIVDHKNGNPLDNRRSNLRICNNSQNQANKFKKIGLSKYKGVSYDKNSKRVKRWMARLEHKGKNITIGRFLTENEAALAYNKKALQIWGNYSIINNVKLGKQVRSK